MDECTIQPNQNFSALRRALGGVIAEVTEIGRSQIPLAAE
jgi:hypothetical protein